MATTNYGWTLPTVGGSEDTWGDDLNTLWTDLDTLLGGVSATEFAILDGATVATAELNTLDGITATTAELNKLDGVTVSTAEINRLDGVTGDIQGQLDGKISGVTAGTGLSGGGTSGSVTLNGVTQSTATWEAGTSTTEGLVSPAKVKAAIDAAPTSNFTSSNGSADIPGGLQFRWGLASSTNDADETFSYNTAFTNETLQCVVTPDTQEGGGNVGMPFVVTAVNASGFTLNRDDDINGTVGVRYIAIGY
jgi:hypothetical protein